MSRARLLPLLLLVLPILAAPGARAGDGNPVTPAPKVSLAWNRFYDYEELTEALEKLAAAYPDWLRIESIGKSVEGRDIPLAVLCEPEGAPEALRPAMWIDANIHGNEIQGGEVCLYTLWYLLENKGLPRVAELLHRVAFYVAPTVNPDGRHRWFHGPTSAHRPRSGLRPFDDDRDGRMDEDGPDDLDGDGSITRMRKRVAVGGTHKPDPEDPRLLVRVRPGEKGEFILLGSEGIDNDGDGWINEDGPGGYDMNRNFPGDWAPNWIQYGAGDYPLCYPETRAVADFVLAHSNIAAVQSYHNSGGMILRGPGDPDRPKYPAADVAVYDRLGREGEWMIPAYRYLVLRDDLYPVRGGMLTWTYEALGIISFTNELWSDRQYSGQTDEEQEGDYSAHRRARLKFSDELEMGRHFHEWKPYHHPRYGDIEIGGFTKAASRVPPVFMLEELCHRNMAFTLEHAREMPELAVAVLESEDLGDGLQRVRAEVENRRLIPTLTQMARSNRTERPDFAHLKVTGGRVVTGGLITGPRQVESIHPQEHRPARLRIESGVGSHGSVRMEWIVEVEDQETFSVVLEFASQKGGLLLATLED